MSRRASLALALLALVTGVAGCHLTGPMPSDLDPGRGRAERTLAASLGNSVRAVLETLDELEVKPEAISIRANDAASEVGKPKWVGQTNAEYLPDDRSFRDLFEGQRLTVANADPQPFAPILISYKGVLSDKRAVVLVVRSLPPEARETRIVTRVGRDGDEAWSRKLLDGVTGRLERTGKIVKPAAAPTAANPDSAPGPAPVPTPGPAGAAPADLPPLPSSP